MSTTMLCVKIAIGFRRLSQQSIIAKHMITIEEKASTNFSSFKDILAFDVPFEEEAN